MHWTFTHEEREYRAALLARPYHLEALFRGTPYGCLLWDTGVAATSGEMADLARRLIDSNCRYVVCAGYDGEPWCNAIDAKVGYEDPDVLVAMWQFPDVSPEEVGRVFVQEPALEAQRLRKFLVLVLGSEAALADRLFSVVRGTGAPQLDGEEC